MVMHPRERPPYDRRRFLRHSLYVSLGAVGGPSLLAACGDSGSGSSSSSDSGSSSTSSTEAKTA